MNKQESDILQALCQEPFVNQRVLADVSGHSLGIVNRSLNALIAQGYLDEQICLTKKAKDELKRNAPNKAIILAAGFGMRMVPINMETPKAFLEVGGEPLIERQIRQLHQAGIREIYVVLGFMKEQFEYLIDDYGIIPVVNPQYARKNNLHSMKLVADKLANAYVIPCDIWCDRNPFRRQELYSWYMVSDLIDDESEVRVNRKMELVKVPKPSGGNTMLGISYISPDDAPRIRQRILELCEDPACNSCFWEEALYQGDRMMLSARIVHSTDVVEINTYEQLRELDQDSQQLKSHVISAITNALHVTAHDISGITVLKEGLTNWTFRFSCKGETYVMRIPNPDAAHLINRQGEAEVYQALSGWDRCDQVVWMNPENGYKLTKYIENARPCDPANRQDVAACMALLRQLHGSGRTVPHSFDLFGQIERYESLWNGVPSAFRDYSRTKQQVFSLKPYIESHAHPPVLTHIDAVPGNFLFPADSESPCLIDWEYAAMQDPHMDIAAFCVRAFYSRSQADTLIDLYFEGACPQQTRTKIYCYIAALGLLWSNWCEYKRNLGCDFGEYSLKQYRFAKEFYRFAKAEMEKQKGDTPCIQ